MLRRGASGRRLATVCFTDMVGSTELAARLGDRRWRELLAAYHGVARRTVREAGGRIVDTAGDGFLALFDRPAAAVACAGLVTDRLHTMGIEVRTGLHTGEVERMGDKIGGIAVHLGARVAAIAGPGEVLITGTVRDLVTGSDLEVADRGVRELKGVPGEWRLFALERPGAVPLDHSALERLSAPALRRRSRRILAATALAAMATVVVVIVLLVHRGGSASSPSVVPQANTVGRIDGHSGSFVVAVAVGRGPTDVAVHGDDVWVANYDDQTFSHVDARTETAQPARAVGGPPAGLAASTTRVWVATPFGLTGGVGGSVLEFDPATNGIAPPIVVGDGVDAVAADNTDVWVTNRVQNTVVRIDATTRATTTIPVGDSPEAIAIGFDSVWVANTLGGTVMRIDPAQNKVIAVVSLRYPPSAIAVGAGAVWVVSRTGNSVTRIDPTSNGVVITIPVGAEPEGIAATSTSVWVAESVAQVVERIDPSSNRSSGTLPVAGHPHGVAAAGDDVWVTVGAS